MKFRARTVLPVLGIALVLAGGAVVAWWGWLKPALETSAGSAWLDQAGPGLLPIVAFAGLIALSLVGIGIAIGVDGLRGRSDAVAAGLAAGAAPITIRLEAAGLQLDSEAAAIVKLIRSYLEASQSYADQLAKAGRSLPILAEADEIRAVVKLLVAENEKMQRDANDLKANLEQSKSQIEKLRSSLAEAQELGLRDPLTSVGNRRCFDKNMAEGIRNARERNEALCLVLGDIDHFKRINDGFGHMVGDEVLRIFAKLLASSVEPDATVARYGGEEFAIILPHTELEDAKQLTERIRSRLEEKRLVVNEGGRQVGRITASFGIAQLADGDDPGRLIQRADDKLFQAKHDGRNRVAIDNPLAA